MARLKSLCVGAAAGTMLMFVSQRAIAQTPPAERPDSPPPAGAPPASPAAPAATPAAPAPEAQPEVPAFFRGTEIGGLVDAYYNWYSPKPEGDAPYRNFDTRHNQFRVNMAQLWLAKAPTTNSRAGYKIKVSGGPATTMVQSLEPGSSS